MPDRPFKSMSREGLPGGSEFYGWHNPPPERRTPCEKCGGLIAEGDWPWCKGSMEDHRR